MSRPPSALRAAGLVLGLVLSFVLAAPVGIILHLDLPVTRRALLRRLDAALEAEYMGRFEWTSLEALSPDRIELGRIRVVAPDGELALQAESATLDGPGFSGLWGLARREPRLVLPRLEIVGAEVDVRRTDDGVPRVLSALAPKPGPPSSRPPPPPSNVTLWFPSIALRNARVRIGSDAAAFALQLETVNADILIEPRRLDVEVGQLVGRLESETVTPVDLRAKARLTAARSRTGAPTGEFGGWLDLSLRDGPTEAAVKGTFVDGLLEAEFVAPVLEPAAFARWVPDAPLHPTRPLGLRVGVRGPRDRLTVAAQLSHTAQAEPSAPGEAPPPGRLDVLVALGVGGQVIGVEASAADLDPSVLDARWPRGQVNAEGSFLINVEPPQAEGRIALPATTLIVDGTREVSLPPLAGAFRAGRGGVEARVRFDELGLPGDVLARLGAGDALEFALSAAYRLGELTRLSEYVAGASRVRGSGVVVAAGTLRGALLDLGARAVVEGLEATGSGARVGRLDVVSRLKGPLDALELDASGDARRLAIGKRAVAKASLRASGPVARPTLSATFTDEPGGSLDVRGVLDVARHAIERFSLELRASGAVLRGSAKAVTLGRGGDVDVSEVHLGGGTLGGSLDGNLALVDGDLSGRMKGDGIDLDEVSRLLRLPHRLEGKVGIDVDVKRTGHGERTGHARVTLSHGAWSIVRGFDANLEVAFEGRGVSSSGRLMWRDSSGVSGCEGALFDASLAAVGELDGPMMSSDTWTRSTGRVSFGEDAEGTKSGAHQGRLELGCLTKLADGLRVSDRLPFRLNRGVAQFGVAVSREVPEGPLSLDRFHLETRGLGVAAKSDSDAPPAWVSDHLDLGLDAQKTEETGRTTLELTVRDGRDPSSTAALGKARLSTRLNPDWLRNPPSIAGLLLGLSVTPFDAEVEVQRLTAAQRQAMPWPWRDAVAPFDGTLHLEARASGTALSPTAAMRATLEGLSSRSTAGAPKLDVELLASHRHGTTRLDAWVDEPRDGARLRRLLSLEALHRSAPKTLFGPPSPGSVHMRAWTRGLPLALIPSKTGRVLSGSVDGHLTIDKTENLTLAARVEGHDVTIDDVALDAARLIVGTSERSKRTTEGSLLVGVRGGGELVVRGAGELKLESGALVVLPDRPRELSVEARRFPLRVALPLMPDVVTRLDGELDGRFGLDFTRLDGRDPGLTSTLVVRDGVLELPRFGQRLHSIAGRLAAEQSRLSLEDVRAVTSTGTLRGRLETRLDGLRLTEFVGELDARDGDGAPIAVDGRGLGTLHGKVELRGDLREPGRPRFEVEGTALTLRLPPSPPFRRARLTPQPLEAHPDVRILQAGAPAQAPSMRQGRYDLGIVLRHAVIRGSGLRLVLSTDPSRPIRSTSTGSLEGSIILEAGELSLLGKTFTVDRGVVDVDAEEPDNPFVNVTAHWDAPDGTVVFVDYVGRIAPITRDDLRFRSTPPRSEDAVVGLLLFGDTYDLDGSTATDAQRRANQALGGALTAELSALFGDLLPGLTAGLSATSEGATATSIGYQVSDRLSAQAILEQAPGTGVLGALGSSSPPSATATTPGVSVGDARTKLGVDFRIGKRWVMRGSLGVSGGAASGVDLVYQLRY